MTQITLTPQLQQALAASAADDSEKALELLTLACAATPAEPLPHFLLGAELAQVKRYDEAEAAYATAVALSPGFHIARFELGTLQMVLSRPATALVTWQPLLELPEGEPLRLFVLGYTAYFQDRFDDALGLFHRGMAANQVNAALNGNIRQVIERVEAAKAEAHAAPALPETASEHVLLDGYRRQGSVS